MTEELTKELEEKRAKIEELETELVSIKEQLEAKNTEFDAKVSELEEVNKKIAEYEEKANAAKLEAIKEITEEIKKLDKEFDSEKFLEGVSCLDSQKALLERYFESVKRVSKVKMETKLEVSDPNSIEAKGKSFLASIGIEDADAFVKNE